MNNIQIKMMPHQISKDKGCTIIEIHNGQFNSKKIEMKIILERDYGKMPHTINNMNNVFPSIEHCQFYR